MLVELCPDQGKHQNGDEALPRYRCAIIYITSLAGHWFISSHSIISQILLSEPDFCSPQVEKGMLSEIPCVIGDHVVRVGPVL